MEKANRKQTIFSSKPLGVTAWILLANNALKLLKTVSMYWRVGLLKNSSHADSTQLLIASSPMRAGLKDLRSHPRASQGSLRSSSTSPSSRPATREQGTSSPRSTRGSTS
jgi:hypothetical protein